MMTKDQFHDTLRQYLHRQPFIPFVVAYGREILISRPPLAFSDRAASFIDLDGDEALVDFFHDQVIAFRPAGQEVGSRRMMSS